MRLLVLSLKRRYYLARVLISCPQIHESSFKSLNCEKKTHKLSKQAGRSDFGCCYTGAKQPFAVLLQVTRSIVWWIPTKPMGGPSHLLLNEGMFVKAPQLLVRAAYHTFH